MLNPRLRDCKHSSEFEWSYAGSGPAQLAFAIVYDHLLTTMPASERREVVERAWRLHQSFKFKMIVQLPAGVGAQWSMTSQDVADCVAAIDAAHPENAA